MVLYCTRGSSALSMEANTEAPLFEGAQRILIHARMQIRAARAKLHCGEKEKLNLTPAEAHELRIHARLYGEWNSNEVELCDILNLAVS